MADHSYSYISVYTAIELVRLAAQHARPYSDKCSVCTHPINNSKDGVEHSPLVSYPCESSDTKLVFSEISPLSHEFHTEQGV